MTEESFDEDAHKPESLSVRLVSETRHTFGTEAARQMWVKLKLPVVPAMLQQTTVQLELFP
jgi:hypothetical protein